MHSTYFLTFLDYEHCLQCYLEKRLYWNWYWCFSRFDFRQGLKGEIFCFDSLETASVFSEVLLVDDGAVADEAVDHSQPLGRFDVTSFLSWPRRC